MRPTKCSILRLFCGITHPRKTWKYCIQPATVRTRIEPHAPLILGKFWVLTKTMITICLVTLTVIHNSLNFVIKSSLTFEAPCSKYTAIHRSYTKHYDIQQLCTKYNLSLHKEKGHKEVATRYCTLNILMYSRLGTEDMHYSTKF